MASPTRSTDAKFTVFIRLPFPRGDFVDPPPVEWNAAKDQALWEILSRPSRGHDIDWKALAENLDVTLEFLLQQAAWLYDRQLSLVRAQMRKAGGTTTQSNSPSPNPGSVSGSTALTAKAAPATGMGARAPPRFMSQQREAQQPGPLPRRSSSGTTLNQTTVQREQESPPAQAQAKAATTTPRWESHSRRPSTSRRDPPSAAPAHTSPTLEEESLPSSSSSSESDDEEVVSSRRGMGFKRFGSLSTHRPTPGLRDDDEDDDDDDDSPAFLPLSREGGLPHGASENDPGATLRLNAAAAAETTSGLRRHGHTNEPSQLTRKSTVNTESSTSSASSGVPVAHPHPHRRLHQSQSQSGGALSPRRAAHLSPRRSGLSGREASDGTPSMGSSFSDLDDASVTQSALEEALLSNMQHGGMASRMSTISQALRSRYL